MASAIVVMVILEDRVLTCWMVNALLGRSGVTGETRHRNAE